MGGDFWKAGIAWRVDLRETRGSGFAADSCYGHFFDHTCLVVSGDLAFATGLHESVSGADVGDAEFA